MMTTPTTADRRAADPAGGAPRHAIEVRQLVCRFGGFEAVRAIDLTIGHGELFALLGTNGAGKTTTLETLQGHRRADGGNVRVLGCEPARDRRVLASRVGVVLQRSGAPEDLTPEELLRSWCRLHRRRRTSVTDVLARVGLDERARVRIRQLSGGERRRLDLALAIATDPQLVFLDEPTTGMDPEGRERTWQVLRDLRRRGTTLVLTTHYLEEAEALADRIAIMDGGRIVAQGTHAELAASRSATIHAELPDEAAGPELPRLRGAVARHRIATGTRIEVATDDLQEDLTRLLGWAQEHAIVLGSLRAADASLAQVFHELSTAGRASGPATDPEGGHR